MENDFDRRAKERYRIWLYRYAVAHLKSSILVFVLALAGLVIYRLITGHWC